MACEHLICIIICFILQKGGLFYKNREDFTWRVPDCEELSLARGRIEPPTHGFSVLWPLVISIT